uniref:DM14 domain-containing protein n=1 Tax=Ciona savignyi TaxID=51511 RepID=H2Z483_CIOSA
MPRSKKERNNVLDMMGYGGGGSDDDGDADFEAELAAMIGGGGPKKPAKKPAPKLIDWSIIDAQVASSMRDVDDDDDDVLSPEDESDLMSELNGLIEEDEPALLKPAAPNRRDRSPSPQPQRPGDVVDELKSRKTMYETAIKNAQSKGESAKVRRLQRGIKTIDTLLRSAKLGKSINEADIPPVVATGQPPSQTSTSPPEIPISEVDLRPKETSPTPTVPTKIMRSSSSP